MAKKKVLNVPFFEGDGDIIDKITREHEYLEQQKTKEQENIDDFNLDLNLDDTQEAPFDITAVAEYYHKKLYESKDALNYLKDKGLSNLEKYTRFKIGFSDGSLKDKLSKSQIADFKKSQILREDGTDYFTDCIVFPVFNDSGQIVCIYGLDTKTDLFIKPLYFDKYIPLFNKKACKVYNEVIFTSNILEALSLIEIGFENVISLNDSADFTVSHIETLKQNRVKTIVFAFDKNHLMSSDSLKDILVADGFKTKVIMLPEGNNSWNESLKNKITKSQIKKLIDEAKVYKQDESKEEFKVIFDNGLYSFYIDGVIYRIAGIKDIFSPNLRVKVRCEIQDKYHRDNLDLYSYRARQNFSSTASDKLDVNSAKIEKSLDRILDYFEDEREKKTTGAVKEERTMTDEEVKTGMAFLKSSSLLKDTIADITKLGYAGEDNNKLIVYLVGLSRYLPKPLSTFVLSNPGTGKSYLVDTVLKLFPDESLKHNSSLSDQAFHYMPETDFDDNIFVMGESLHNPIIEGYIRQMQTENMLSRSVVKKDESTGEMRTENITHKVRLVFMTTSPKMDINLENVSRCILLKIDESKAQTDNVLEKQRENDTYEKQIEADHIIPAVIKKHVLSQRLLKPVRIYNPFAKYIQFPSHRAIFRRNQPHFLILIKTLAFWRQHQKKIIKKINPYTKKEEDWIECDLYDYQIARQLFIECRILDDMDDLPEKMVFLYEKIYKMVGDKAKKENLSVQEITFIQSEVREIKGLDIGHVSIKRYLRMLVDYEFIVLVGTKQNGVKNTYKLREDKPIKKIEASEIIPTADEIKAMIKADKAKNQKIYSNRVIPGKSG